MKSNKIWTTKDGRSIKIKDMEDSHLINTIRYCFSRPRAYHQYLEQVAMSAYGYSGGEMAEMAAQSEADNLTDLAYKLRDEKIMPNQMPYLIKEAQKRNLNLPHNYDPDYITQEMVFEY
jgi:hypothetical protein